MQRNLLNPPIVHVGDIHSVLRRACQRMCPVELSYIVARFPQVADQFPIGQREFVEPARFLIDRIQILRRSVGDAKRPRRRFVWSNWRDVSEYGVPLLVVRRVLHDVAKMFAVGIENLDAAVASVGCVDVAFAVNGDIMRRVELAISAPARTPRRRSSCRACLVSLSVSYHSRR